MLILAASDCVRGADACGAKGWRWMSVCADLHAIRQGVCRLRSSQALGAQDHASDQAVRHAHALVIKDDRGRSISLTMITLPSPRNGSALARDAVTNGNTRLAICTAIGEEDATVSARQGDPSLGVTITLALIAAVLIGLPLLPNMLGGLPGHVSMTARVVVACVMLAAGLGILVWVQRRFVKRWDAGDGDRSPGRPVPESLGSDEAAQIRDIANAISQVRAKYDPAAIGLFCGMLIGFGNGYRTRATQRAELLGTSLRISTTINHAISAAERHTLVEGGSTCFPVPFLWLEKGQLLDNFEISGSGGNSLATLPQYEMRGLIAIALGTLFDLTFKREDQTAEASQAARSARSDEEHAALWALRRLVCRIGRLKAAPNVGVVLEEDEVSKIFKDAVGKFSPATGDRMDDLRDFCRIFARYYVLAVEMPIPDGVRFIVKYQRDTPILGAPDRRDKLRTRFGLRPYRFGISLDIAFTAASYHFRMDNGENQFVSHHYIRDRSTASLVQQDAIRRLVPHGYVRVHHNTGLPYAHLYVRGLNRSRPQNWVTVVEFEEAPPGALGATLVVSAVTAALITAMSFIPSNGPSADTSALLLAVPLFAATFVGHSVERVQRSSLATYTGLICVGVTAFLAAILFGLAPSDWLMLSDVRLLGAIRIGGVNVGGLALAVVTVANVVFLYWVHRYRMQRYLKMLDRWRNIDTLFI